MGAPTARSTSYACPPQAASGSTPAPAHQRDIYIYAVHFKSKGNSTSCSTPDCTDKRELEAEDLRDILAHHQGAGEYAIAGGDYNDTFGSTPIGFLDASRPASRACTTTWASAARYSYIFNGESEVLDHYYTTANLLWRRPAGRTSSALCTSTPISHPPNMRRITTRCGRASAARPRHPLPPRASASAAMPAPMALTWSGPRPRT